MRVSVKVAFLALLVPAATSWATRDECSGQVDGFISGLKMGGGDARAQQIEAQRVSNADCVVRSSIPEIRKSDEALAAASAAARSAILPAESTRDTSKNVAP